MGLTVLSHGVLVALVFYSHILGSSSPEVARSYIFTNLVSLDRRLEKPWLPPTTPSKEPAQSENQAKSTLPMGDNEMNLNTATLIQDGKRRRRERTIKIARNTSAPYDESDEESMAPAMISMAVAKSQLLTDPEIDRRYRFTIPPELNRAGVRMSGLIKICVLRSGDVRSATLVKSMDPSADPLLIAKAKTWKYRPFTIEGHPVPFCYNLRYDVEIQ
jgi:hypothetical protein